MKGHVSAEALIDIAEGAGAQESRVHVADCGDCRQQAEALRRELGVLGDIEVPEPPGMYWEAFRRQVGSRLEREPQAVAWRPWLVPLAAAAVVVVSLVVREPSGPDSPKQMATSTLPAWSALPAGDEDAGLVVLQALADEGQLPGGSSCNEVVACLESLSDDDAVTFVNVLRGELGGRRL